jgi:hypothetical protein
MNLLDHLAGIFGPKLERQGRYGTYQKERSLTDVFRNDSARQENDARKKMKTGLRRFQEPDDWLR